MTESRNCPFCKGEGRKDDLLCLSCDGTGDYEGMMLLRAYRIGLAHERAKVTSTLTGDEIVERQLGLDALKAAVTDDYRRQRLEDALQPNTTERRSLEAKVEALMREREGLLDSLGRVARELRQEIEA